MNDVANAGDRHLLGKASFAQQLCDFNTTRTDELDFGSIDAQHVGHFDRVLRQTAKSSCGGG